MNLQIVAVVRDMLCDSRIWTWKGCYGVEADVGGR